LAQKFENVNNNGFVLIDELDKMKKEDRSALLECMEQQSISLAKAGVSATIHSGSNRISVAWTFTEWT